MTLEKQAEEARREVAVIAGVLCWHRCGARACCDQQAYVARAGSVGGARCGRRACVSFLLSSSLVAVFLSFQLSTSQVVVVSSILATLGEFGAPCVNCIWLWK